MRTSQRGIRLQEKSSSIRSFYLILGPSIIAYRPKPRPNYINMWPTFSFRSSNYRNIVTYKLYRGKKKNRLNKKNKNKKNNWKSVFLGRKGRRTKTKRALKHHLYIKFSRRTHTCICIHVSVSIYQPPYSYFGNASINFT